MTRRSAAGLLAAFALAGPSPAAPLTSALPADGTEVFRGLFAYAGVRPADPDRYNTRHASHTILVITGVGGGAGVGHLAALVGDVLDGGGAVLVAADHRLRLARFFPDGADAAVTGRKVYCPKPALCFDGNPWCPVVGGPFPVLARQASPLDLGAMRVATNVASVVRRPAPSKYLEVKVGNFPTACVLDGPGGRRLSEEEGFAFASGDGRPFRSLVVGDPGVFSNEMLLAGRPDDPAAPQNLSFALQVVEWLKVGPEGRTRTRCLFFEDGRPKTNFDEVGFAPPPPAEIPAPPLPSPLDPKIQAGLANAGNKAFAKLEEGGRLDHAITGGPDDPDRLVAVLRGLAVAAAAGGVIWLLARGRAARAAVDGPSPRVPAPPIGVAEGSVAHRGLELARLGQYTEPVREAVRSLFAAAGLPPGAVGPPPPVEAAGPAGGELARQVDALWRAVLAPGARPITPARWKELGPMYDAVRRAAEAGRWRFPPAGGPA